MKTKQEIFDFLNANKAFCLATIENGKPRARFMLMFRADEDGIIFNTGKVKDVYHQLIANPEVELCFYNPKDNIQVRVSGTLLPDEDMNLKKEIVSKHEFLKPWIEKHGYEFMTPFRMKNGKAIVWTFDKNFTPKEPIEL